MKNTINANAVLTTRYEARWGKYVPIENPTTEVVNKYTIFSEMFDTFEEADNRLWEISLTDSPCETNVIEHLYADGEEITEDEWREIKAAQREARHNTEEAVKASSAEAMNTTYIAFGIWTDRGNHGMTYTTFTDRNAAKAAETCKDNAFDAKLILSASEFADMLTLDGVDRIINLFETLKDIELTARIDDLFRGYRDRMEHDINEQAKFTRELNAA